MARLRVLLLAGLLSLGQAAAAAERGPYPVWWSPELGLESLETVEARLQRDLWPNIGLGFALYPDGNPSRAKIYARTCEALLRYSDQGYWAPLGKDLKVQSYNLALCRAIALLGQARLAEESFLRDFDLDAAAVDDLPALVNLYPSCERICDAVAANARGVSLAAFDDIESVEALAEGPIVVWTTGWSVEMRLLARGDFSADGLEDVLLFAHGGATEGTYRATGLFVLTRRDPAGILHVIDAERRLCQHTYCRAQ